MIDNQMIELQDVLNYILDREGIPTDKVHLEFKNIQRGIMYEDGRLKLPIWALRQGIFYSYYYLIHEISHYIRIWRKTPDGCSGHGQEFKSIERFWLAEFGLYPKYGKAYAKKLFSESGILLWEKPKW